MLGITEYQRCYPEKSDVYHRLLNVNYLNIESTILTIYRFENI